MVGRKPQRRGMKGTNKVRSSGREQTKIDTKAKKDFGLTRTDIKRLPIKSAQDVLDKARALQEYIIARRFLAEEIALLGGPRAMLVNEIGDLQVMLMSMEGDPSREEEYLELKLKYVDILMKLQRLGFDAERLGIEKERLEVEGMTFTVGEKK